MTDVEKIADALEKSQLLQVDVRGYPSRDLKKGINTALMKPYSSCVSALMAFQKINPTAIEDALETLNVRTRGGLKIAVEKNVNGGSLGAKRRGQR